MLMNAGAVLFCNGLILLTIILAKHKKAPQKLQGSSFMLNYFIYGTIIFES